MSMTTHLHALAAQLNWSAAELRHAQENYGVNYGAESVIPLANGRAIHTPTHPQPCDYVRITHMGHELGYWTSDEWRDDPACAMGAIMGCAHASDTPTSLQRAAPRPT